VSTPRKLVAAQVGVGHFGAARREYMRQTGLFDLVACYDLKPEAMAHAEKYDTRYGIRDPVDRRVHQIDSLDSVDSVDSLDLPMSAGWLSGQ